MPPLIILMPFELAHVNAVVRNAVVEGKKPLDNNDLPDHNEAAAKLLDALFNPLKIPPIPPATITSVMERPPLTILPESPSMVVAKAADSIPFLTIELNFILGIAKDSESEVIFICPMDDFKLLPLAKLTAN